MYHHDRKTNIILIHPLIVNFIELYCYIHITPYIASSSSSLTSADLIDGALRFRLLQHSAALSAIPVGNEPAS